MAVNVNKVHKRKMSTSNRIALWIFTHVGTMEFFYFCIALVTLPLLWPLLLPYIQYVSSGYLQLILLPLIMIGQNLQSRHSELRAENDYWVDKKTEEEIETIKQELAEIKTMIGGRK